MFQGLSTALSALYAFQQELETTGNNIANVNTEGYSRQRVNLVPEGGQTVSSFWATPPKIGTGVTVESITRTRDEFLDARSLQEHATEGDLTQTEAALTNVEQIFHEPSDTGLQKQLAQFWSAWDAVTGADLPPRTAVIENAKTLITSVQDAHTSLEAMRISATDSMRNDVSQLNAWAKQISDLNLAIRSAMQSEARPNALLDQRDLLISKMSDLADVSVFPTAFGSVSVSIGGVPIVRDERVTNLEVDTTGITPVLRWDRDGDPNVVANGIPATVSGGKIAGELRTAAEIAPRYIANLDTMVGKLITLVNTQHMAGQDTAGNAGVPFFTGTNAQTIAVNPVIAGDPTRIAAAKAGGGTLDNENARAMANLSNSQVGPDTYYRQFIDQLGVESQTAINRSKIQHSITVSVDNQRDSVSGVSLDQEMTNLVRYQQSYAAAAKYVNSLNETLDALLGIIK